MADPNSPIRKALRKAIEQSGRPASEWATVAGLHKQSVYPFLDGKRGLTIDGLERLFVALGLIVVPRRAPPTITAEELSP